MCGQESLTRTGHKQPSLLFRSHQVAWGQNSGDIIYSKNIKHLPCARHCPECGVTAMNKADRNSVFKDMTFWWEVVSAAEMKQVRGGS